MARLALGSSSAIQVCKAKNAEAEKRTNDSEKNFIPIYVRKRDVLYTVYLEAGSYTNSEEARSRERVVRSDSVATNKFFHPK